MNTRGLLDFRIKDTGDQYDDRIVEVHWDTAAECWRMMRFRDDKPHGNHRTVVHKIIESIRDGVEKEAVSLFLLSNERSLILGLCQKLLDRSISIRNAWKSRHGQPPTASGGGAPPGHAAAPPPQPVQHLAPPRMASVESEIRYGPIAVSKWSKVSGPEVWAGMYR